MGSVTTTNALPYRAFQKTWNKKSKNMVLEPPKALPRPPRGSKIKENYMPRVSGEIHVILPIPPIFDG